MNEGWKLHGYYKQLESKLRRIKSCELCSKLNQKYFLEYSDFLLAQGLSVPRISKCLRLAVKLDEVLDKDLKKLTKKDIIHYLGVIQKSKYSAWTKNDFNIGLKKFVRWLHNGKEPKYLEVVKTGVKNANKLLPQEILTEKEVLKLISESQTLRDKALISCLYESGCRIGELLTLRLKHIVFDEYGVKLNVNGKTGVRQVRLISSTSLLSQWISDHPHKDNTNSFLWCSYRYKTNELIGYRTVSKLLKKLSSKINLTKKVNPHSFRHARCTHLANKLTEAQMKMYFGWTQSSKMAAVYVHLSGRDVDNAILEAHGIIRKEKPKETFCLKKCRCGQSNPPTNKYCSKCGQILNLKLQMEVEEKKNLVNEFVKNLVDKPELFEKIKELMVKA